MTSQHPASEPPHQLLVDGQPITPPASFKLGVDKRSPNNLAQLDAAIALVNQYNIDSDNIEPLITDAKALKIHHASLRRLNQFYAEGGMISILEWLLTQGWTPPDNGQILITRTKVTTDFDDFDVDL